MHYKDYYKIMGLSRETTQDEIKRAYRKLARKYHPDVSKEKDAEAKFKELGEAYEVLKDPEKRAAYDLDHLRIGMKVSNLKVVVSPVINQVPLVIFLNNYLVKQEFMLQIKGNLILMRPDRIVMPKFILIWKIVFMV